jgi:hypothetical protein
MLIHLAKHSKKKLITKQCAFPGCGKSFRGIGPTRYCKEHRTVEARQHMSRLYAAKKKEARLQVDDQNQVISHKFITAAMKTCVCALDGCDETFDIKILPHVNVYPKYCAEHRSEWKREWHRRKQA